MKNRIVFTSVFILIIGIVMLFGSSYSLIMDKVSNDNTININNIDNIYNKNVNIKNENNRFIFKINNNTNIDINYRLDITNISNNFEYNVLLNNNYIDIDSYTINQNRVLEVGNNDIYIVELISGNISNLNISIYATKNIDKYAHNVIERLSIQSNEISKDNKDFRYNDINPNNYISFNNELWRIIGSFNIDNYYSLKIMKATPSDKTNFNNMELTGDYDNSYVNTYLNGSYYEKLDDNYKKMIRKVNWNIGNTSVNNFYDSINNEKKKTYNTYIGLISPSDYLYLGHNNWIKYNEKIMLLNKNNNYINVINNGITINNQYEELYYIPCLYLRSDVSIISGDGTILNPYKLDIIYPLNMR